MKSNDNIKNHIESQVQIQHQLFPLIESNYLSEHFINFTGNIGPNIINKLCKCQFDINFPFMLIIDFANIGGGATFFLNCIISYYSEKINFIIIREFNKKYFITYNDKISQPKLSTLEQIKNILNTKSHLFHKIFFNHTYQINPDFISFALHLGKINIGITHDFHLVSKKLHPTYLDVIENHHKIHANTNTTEIERMDFIITQNKTNIKHLQKFTDYNRFVVCTLPDYAKRGKIIITRNQVLVIGIIGDLFIHKGLETVLALYKTIDKTLFKIVIYGRVDRFVKKTIQGYPTDSILNMSYTSISELNNHLETTKPDCILSCSSGLETYSYTLTLAMLTDLPILYPEYPGQTTISNRLEDYSKAYCFQSVIEIPVLVKRHTQNYLYLIDNSKIYFNPLWDKIFLTNLLNN